MAKITQNISVEVSKPNFFAAIVAKQYDSGSRYLKATFVHDSKIVQIPNTSTTTINAKRSDGEEKSFAGKVNNDNTVTVPLASWMLELVGTVKCDISVLGTDGSKLTSTTFVLEVQEASCESGDVSKDENYDVLIKLIEDVGKVTPDQTYKPTSEQAQSGKAVAEAISSSIDLEFIPPSKNAQSGLAVAEAVDKATDMFDDRRNLLTNIGWTKDKSLNAQGEPTDTDGYKVSNKIYVFPNTTYSANCSVVCFYRSNNFFIENSALWSANTFTTPSNCYYVRVSVPDNTTERYFVKGEYTARPPKLDTLSIKKLQIENENIKGKSIDGNQIKFETITPDNLAFAKTNTNYLTGADCYEETKISPTGVVSEESGYCSSDYVGVKTKVKYVLEGYSNAIIVGYTAEKDVIGNVSHTNGVFTTSKDCHYLRVCNTDTGYSKMALFEASANRTQPNTFTMDGLMVEKGNLAGDVLSAVKTPTTSILADLVATPTKRIVLIGDSITHGACSTDFEAGTEQSDFLFNTSGHPQYRNYGVKCWAGMLCDYLKKKFKCTAINNGASGAHIYELIDNWDAIVSPDDDVVICMIGTNDRPLTTATIYGHMVTIYEKAQANNQKLIFVSPPPASVTNETMEDYRYIIHLEDIDNVYNYASSTLDVGYVSVYKAFLNYCREHDVTVDSLLDTDGVHPNDEGYKLMFEIVLENLGFGRKRDGATW